MDHDEELKTLHALGLPMSRPPWRTGKSYGLGLKESKDWMDRWLDRETVTNP